MLGNTGIREEVISTLLSFDVVNLKDIFDYEEPYNNVAHAYNQAVALDIVRQTKEFYYPMFAALKKNVEENWITME